VADVMVASYTGNAGWGESDEMTNDEIRMTDQISMAKFK
jgi:hypothetical protein